MKFKSYIYTFVIFSIFCISFETKAELYTEKEKFSGNINWKAIEEFENGFSVVVYGQITPCKIIIDSRIGRNIENKDILNLLNNKNKYRLHCEKRDFTADVMIFKNSKIKPGYGSFPSEDPELVFNFPNYSEELYINDQVFKHTGFEYDETGTFTHVYSNSNSIATLIETHDQLEIELSLFNCLDKNIQERIRAYKEQNKIIVSEYSSDFKYYSCENKEKKSYNLAVEVIDIKRLLDDKRLNEENLLNKKNREYQETIYKVNVIYWTLVVCGVFLILIIAVIVIRIVVRNWSRGLDVKPIIFIRKFFNLVKKKIKFKRTMAKIKKSEQLKDLYDKGVISKEEYEKLKKDLFEN